MSFAEIISVFGSKSAKMEELERARDQMLTMQGIMLQGRDGTGESQTDLREVTDLMESLERYVAAVEYNSRVQELKEQVEVNYNIVSDLQEQEEKKEEPKQEETDGKKFIEFKFLLTGSAISDTEKPSGGEEGTETAREDEDGVVTVSPEEWTDIKRIQMTEFTGLIFDHPVNLYCPQVKVGTLETYFLEEQKETEDGEAGEQKTYQEKFKEFQDSAYAYRKSFLDTSDSEKAYNMLFRREYFPYGGKAQLSAAFAIFLDVGAFAIGFLMYRAGKRTENGSRKKEKRCLGIGTFRESPKQIPARNSKNL